MLRGHTTLACGSSTLSAGPHMGLDVRSDGLASFLVCDMVKVRDA